MGTLWIGFLGVAFGCAEPPPEFGEGDPMPTPAAVVADAPLPAAACLDGACEIWLDTVARIVDVEGLLPELAFFERDSAGRIWVTGYQRDSMLRFDVRTGAIDTVGRAGDGPGEFRRIGLPIMGPGDSLYVHDVALQRATVISPDLEIARTFRLQNVPSLPVGDGRFIVSGLIGTREAAGYPLHLVSEDNPEIEVSFGTDEPRLVPEERHLLTRVVGHGADGTFWAAAPGRFEFERWDPLSQVLLTTLTPPVPPWLEGLEERRAGSVRLVRPDPTISQVWEDAHSVLWVLVRIPDPDWAPAEGSYPPWLDPDDYADIYDWMLLALDPETGTLVSEVRFDRRVNIRPTHSVLVQGAEYVADTLVFHLSVPRLAR